MKIKSFLFNFYHLKSWLLSKSPEISKILTGLFDPIFEELIIMMETKLTTKMKVPKINYVKQVLSILDGILTSDEHFNEIRLHKLFIFGVMWSFGALLELDDR